MSDIISEILKETPIKTRLYVQFTMSDYDNWDNGQYKGDIDKIKQDVNFTIDKIKKWIEDGMPGGFDYLH